MTTEQRDALREIQDRYIEQAVRMELNDWDIISKDGITIGDLRTTLYRQHEDAFRSALAGEPVFQ